MNISAGEKSTSRANMSLDVHKKSEIRVNKTPSRLFMPYSIDVHKKSEIRVNKTPSRLFMPYSRFLRQKRLKLQERIFMTSSTSKHKSRKII